MPCGPIYSIDQMFEDAQVKHLGIAQDVPNDENRHIRLIGQPVTLSRTPSKMAARPPEFGEQTEECSPSSASARRDRGVAASQGGVAPPSYSVFERSMPPDLIRGWISVRVKKTRSKQESRASVLIQSEPKL